MDNFPGNVDPNKVFHNRCTSLFLEVGTGRAVECGGFGNPRLHREIGMDDPPCVVTPTVLWRHKPQEGRRFRNGAQPPAPL